MTERRRSISSSSTTTPSRSRRPPSNLTGRETDTDSSRGVRSGGPFAVSCRNVSFTYPTADEPALSGVSFEVKPGDYVGVVGPNGGGKSTLVRLLNGLLKADSGDIRVMGLDPAAEPFEVRKSVGMLFQNPDNGLVAPFVEDDVAFGLENLGIAPVRMKEKVGEAISTVGLDGYERRETATLSGGEKQRVALAGLLAAEPEVLILDEPTSMLDPAGRSEVLNRLDELRNRKTIIHVTHHLEELFDADKVIVLAGGEILAELTPGVLLSDEAVMRRANLAPPVSVRLAARLGLEPRRTARELAEAVISARESGR